MNGYFLCYGWDGHNKLALRLKHRQEHLDRIVVLDKLARVKLAGPVMQEASDSSAANFAGSMLVVEFASLIKAREWWQADPYIINGVFHEWGVRPYVIAFPKVYEYENTEK